MQRIDIIPYNPRAKGIQTGPCKALFSLKATLCGQRGKATIVKAAERKAILALLKDRNSFRGPTATRCWAPRHGLVLMDKDSEQIGYFDVSLPCGKIRGGDRNGAMQTPDGKVYEDITDEARLKLAAIFKRAGLSVDKYIAEPVPRGRPLEVQKITGYLPQTGLEERKAEKEGKKPIAGH